MNFLNIFQVDATICLLTFHLSLKLGLIDAIANKLACFTLSFCHMIW